MFINKCLKNRISNYLLFSNRSNKLFYFNTKDKALEMTSLTNASDSKHLMSIAKLQTLAVEWVTDKLYWVSICCFNNYYVI